MNKKLQLITHEAFESRQAIRIAKMLFEGRTALEVVEELKLDETHKDRIPTDLTEEKCMNVFLTDVSVYKELDLLVNRDTVGADELARKITAMVNSDISDVIKWDKNGNITMVPSAEISKERLLGITEISCDPKKIGTDLDGNPVIRSKVVVKMAKKDALISLLAKMKGLTGTDKKHVINNVILLPASVDREAWQRQVEEYQQNKALEHREVQ